MELRDYALPVHKSLQQPDLLLGLPKIVFALILCLSIVFVNFFGPVFALAGLVFYLPCYFISKADPQLLTIDLESLFQIDYFEG
jgi:type IV secretory pathway VirB3-like protein